MSPTPFPEATVFHGHICGICCFARNALAEVVPAKHKKPEVDSPGSLCVPVRAGYSADAALAPVWVNNRFSEPGSVRIAGLHTAGR